MFTERGQGLIRGGAMLLLLSVLSGFAIPYVSEPVLGLAAHIQGIMNAFMIIIVGLIWSRMEIGYLGSVTVYWGLLYGGFVTLVVQWACTFLEIGGSVFPIAGGDHIGTPFQEMVVRIATQSAAVVTFLAIVLMVRAVVKKPAV